MIGSSAMVGCETGCVTGIAALIKIGRAIRQAPARRMATHAMSVMSQGTPFIIAPTIPETKTIATERRPVRLIQLTMAGAKLYQS
jgi:hypothetical protein